MRPEDDLGKSLERIEDPDCEKGRRLMARGGGFAACWKASSIASASIVNRRCGQLFLPRAFTARACRARSSALRRCGRQHRSNFAISVAQVQEHTRAGHVDLWRRREVTDDEADPLHRVEPREHGVEERVDFGIEIDDAGLDAEGEHAGSGLIIGVALEIRVENSGVRQGCGRGRRHGSVEARRMSCTIEKITAPTRTRPAAVRRRVRREQRRHRDDELTAMQPPGVARGPSPSRGSRPP